MTIEEQIEEFVNKQILDIKKLYPNIGEQELKFIKLCLRSTYTKGAADAMQRTLINIYGV